MKGIKEQKIKMLIMSANRPNLLKTINKIEFIAEDTGAKFSIEAEKVTYSAIVEIINPVNKTIDALMKYKLPKGVDVEVKGGKENKDDRKANKEKI